MNNATERLDDLHRNGLKIWQNPKEFCFGMDAVLLTGIVQAAEGERILDLGTGTGVIPLLLTAKTKARHITGLEIQQASVEMARRSVKLNGLEDAVTIDQGDIKNAAALYKPSSFDVITCNPPYVSGGGGLQNPTGAKAIARHEILCTLTDVLDAAARLLRPGGRLYMVHRPHRLTDILCGLRERKLEPKTLQLVHSRQDTPPSMVLVSAVRGGKPMLAVQKPLIIYNGSEYTDEVRSIYYD